MPTIRDGRGQLHVHDLTPRLEVQGPAPVERSHVSAQRMADIAADLAREAAIREAVAGRRRSGGRQTAAEVAASRRRGSAVMHERAVARHAAKQPEEPPMPHHDAGRSSEPRPAKSRGPGTGRHGQDAIDRDARAQQALAALEQFRGDRELAAASMGLRLNAFSMIVKHARIRSGDVGDRRRKRTLVTPPTSSITVALAADLPCVDCSHAAVCYIRPALEAWRDEVATVDVPQPDLVAARVKTARLEIECDHYRVAPDVFAGGQELAGR